MFDSVLELASKVQAADALLLVTTLYQFYNKNVYELELSDATSFDEALHKIKSWDYNSEGPIAIGKLYEVDRPRFEENYAGFTFKKEDRTAKLQQALKKFI